MTPELASAASDSHGSLDGKTVAQDRDYLSHDSPRCEPQESSSAVHGESTPSTSGQIPTPVSTPGEPNLRNTADLSQVAVSTAFSAESVALHDSAPPDVIILSSDHVFFCVHSHRLLAASANNFCHRLPASAEARNAVSRHNGAYVLTLPEDSLVLNVMLHTIYGLSCAHYSPSLTIIAAAVAALKTYAVPLAPHLARGTPLYALILMHAPLPGCALEAFALAAENQLEDLAVAVSPYVLPLEPDGISNVLARRIGGEYMKRLWALRERRHSAMRAMIVAPPFPHAPDHRCTPADRQGVARAWLLAAAQLVWDFKPDMSPYSVRAVLGSLSEQVGCPVCSDSLATRTNEVIVQWSLLDRTI